MHALARFRPSFRLTRWLICAASLAAVVVFAPETSATAASGEPTYLTGAPASTATVAKRACTAERRRVGASRFSRIYAAKHRAPGKTATERCRFSARTSAYKRWLTSEATHECRAPWAMEYRTVAACRVRARSEIAASRRANAALRAAHRSAPASRVASCRHRSLADPNGYDAQWRPTKTDRSDPDTWFDLATSAARNCQRDEAPVRDNDPAFDDERDEQPTEVSPTPEPPTDTPEEGEVGLCEGPSPAVECAPTETAPGV